MGISVYKIKKWCKMLAGKSISHVNQGIGRNYSKISLQGYYNDLTEKVTNDAEEILVPIYSVDTGDTIYFSIGIFQYGLGSYDLYLQTKDNLYIKKLLSCAEWAIENQQSNGGWITFEYDNREQPYSSMAQGEGISLLIRAYIATGENKYLDCAHKAKDFMLLSLNNGGTTRYDGQDVYLLEYTYDSVVLNGWIFSLWGLYDYCLFFDDTETKKVLDATLETLKKKLPDFDIGYWSKYDDGKRITSPFYHRLHIAQLKVMYDLTGDAIYKEYADKWEKYLNSPLKKARAFIVKAIQKILE